MAGYTSPSKYLMFNPDWDENKPKIRRSWVTNIITAKSGKEQRSAWASIVRHGFTYQFTTITELRMSIFKAYMAKYQYAIVGVPIWPYDMILTADANAGSTTIQVEDTANREMDHWDRVIIGDAETYEDMLIDSYDGTSITVSEAIGSTWLTGQKIYPVMRAILSTKVSSSRVAPHVLVVQIDAEESFVWSSTDGELA